MSLKTGNESMYIGVKVAMKRKNISIQWQAYNADDSYILKLNGNTRVVEFEEGIYSIVFKEHFTDHIKTLNYYSN